MAAKKALVNKPEDVVPEATAGLLAAYPALYAGREGEPQIILGRNRLDAAVRDAQVAVISGGGAHGTRAAIPHHSSFNQSSGCERRLYSPQRECAVAS